MLFAEPPKTQWDLNFSVAGIPVRVHPMFWLVGAFMGRSLEPRLIIVWVVVVFVSILVHELGHAAFIRAFGDRTWVVLYWLGGLAMGRSTYHRPWRNIAILAAGPGAGFVLAGLTVAALYIFGYQCSVGFADYQVQLGGGTPLYVLNRADFRQLVEFEPVTDAQIEAASGQEAARLRQLQALQEQLSLQREVLAMSFRGLLYVNIFWGLINLFPVFPLDGGQIARELLCMSNPRDGTRQSLQLSLVTAGCLAVFGVYLQDYWIATLFGYLAYIAYSQLQPPQHQGYQQW